MLLSLLAAFVGSPAGAAEVVDRILAVVDEDPILASDVERLIGLGLAQPGDDEDPTDFRRRILDGLVEQKLRFHEIDRFGLTQIPQREVDTHLAELAERLGGGKVFNERVKELGLDEQGLRELVSRQLLVLLYVEERLGPRVFVSLDEVATYHQEVLTPELEAQGLAVPRVDEVREQIRAVLREQRLNEEIDRWTAQLRAEADVHDFFDAPLDELPENAYQVR